MMADVECRGLPLFYRDADANTYGVLNVREAFAAEHPELVERVLAVYERGRQWALANPDALAEILADRRQAARAGGGQAARSAPSSSTRGPGEAQRETIVAAGQALQGAGIIKADVDVAGDGRRPARAELRRQGRRRPMAGGLGRRSLAGRSQRQRSRPAPSGLAACSGTLGARPAPAARRWRCCGSRRAPRLDRGPPAAAALAVAETLAELPPPATCRATSRRRSGAWRPASRSASCWRRLLGALTGFSTRARQVLDPTLQALRAIPSIAWVPLFILWFGIFEASKVALIAIGAFFPVYLALMTGIQGVDRKLVEVGRVYQLGSAGADPAHPGAGRPARLAHRRARRARARLDVRDRGRAHGCLRGPGLPPARRPDDRQRGPDPGALVLFAILGKATDAAGRRR